MMRPLLLALVLVAGCGGATPPATTGDMLPASGDGALLPFGAACTMDAQCASGVCFAGTRSFCSLRCSAATQAADCPVPPTSGTCNMQGYCKP